MAIMVRENTTIFESAVTLRLPPLTLTSNASCFPFAPVLPGGGNSDLAASVKPLGTIRTPLREQQGSEYCKNWTPSLKPPGIDKSKVIKPFIQYINLLSCFYSE